MDTIDMVIVEELEANSRRSYREIADKLDMSVNSVHKRVQNMIEIGTLQSTIARLGWVIEPPVIATTFGHSEAPDLVATIQELGTDEHTNHVVVATGNNIYLQWYLKDLGELDYFLEVAREKANIRSPQVVFRTVAHPAENEDVKLSGLDWRLIDSLLDDSRRPVVELADELGVSTKTVRRRLSRMESEGSIRYTARFVASFSHDIYSFFHASLRRDLDRRDVVTHLLEKYQNRIVDAMSVDSDPHLVFLSGWTKTMKELKDLKTELEGEPFFESMFINIYFDTHYFDTWREDLVRSRAEEAVRR
jgi:DNA-binding Lrp family transcriptional regulator